VNENTTEVVSILGNHYTIKVPAGEAGTLRESVSLLKQSLSETKRLYPSLIGDQLLVLAALNLCSRQVVLSREHAQSLDRYQEQVSATVAAISRAIAQN
jgi:cell division protein ZapA